YELVEGIVPVGQKKKYDPLWEGEYTYFIGTAEFRQKLKILEQNPLVEGTISYQICSDESGQCIPFDYDFSFRINTAGGSGEQGSVAPKTPPSDAPQGKADNTVNPDEGKT